jgi:hypothetical protein
VTAAHPTVFKQLALLVSAALTAYRSKIIKHLLEIGIFFKNRVTQQGFKSLGIDVEISQFFLEFQTVSADIPIHMGKACFSTQAAGGDGSLDLFLF